MSNSNKLSGLALLFFISSLFVNTDSIIDGSLLSKHYFAIALGSVLIVYFSVNLIFRKKELRICLTPVEFSIFILLFYIGLRLLCMPFIMAYLKYYILLIILVVFVMATKKLIFQAPKAILFLTFILLSLGFFEGIYGLLQHAKFLDYSIFNYFKIDGSFDSPTPYSNYLVPILIFGFGFFLYFKPNSILQTVLRYFTLATSIIIALVLVFTDSRTSWIAGIVGIIIVSYPLLKGNYIFKLFLSRTKHKFVLFTILSIIIVSIAVFLYQYKPQSADGRLLVYEVSHSMIKNKPVFGHGFCRFIGEYNNYQAAYFKTHPNSNYEQLADNVLYGFNEFIQLTVELGIIGLLIFIGIVVLILKSKTKPKWDYIVLPAKSSLVGILICCLFSYPLHSLPLAVNIVFLLSIVMAANKNKSYSFTISETIFKPFAIFLITATLLICIWQWKDYEARKQWKQADFYAQIYDFKNALPLYLNAYRELKYDGFFLSCYGEDLMIANPIKANKILNEAKRFNIHNNSFIRLGDSYILLNQFDKAEEAYILSSLIVPSRFIPKYKLFILYCETKKYFEAKKVANIILQMKVKVPSTKVDLIKSDVKKWLVNQNKIISNKQKI
jgi:O-antigen ligase